MTEIVAASHPDAGQLVRYIDGELLGDESSTVEAHVSACADCTRRVEQLRRRSAALHRMLGELERDTDSPRDAVRPRSTRFALNWRTLAAAAVLLVVGVGATVKPLRAWIVNRSQALWELVVGSGSPEAPFPTPPPEASGPEGSVSFAPTGDLLTIEIATRQRSGTVTVEAVGGSSVSVELAGGSGQGDITVLPTGVRIANALSTTASYRIGVPVRMRRVILVIAGDTVISAVPRAVGDAWDVNVGEGEGR